MCMVADQGGNMEMSKQLPERRQVTGTVIQVNEEHHWFRVEYRLPGSDTLYRETFKMADPPGFLPWKHGHRSDTSIIMKELSDY